eukprot:UN28279
MAQCDNYMSHSEQNCSERSTVTQTGQLCTDSDDCGCTENACLSGPCSNNGECSDGGTSEFACRCVDGWSGETCDIPPICQADTDCNGHGRTSDMDATNGCECVCDDNVVGDACDIFFCGCLNGVHV